MTREILNKLSLFQRQQVERYRYLYADYMSIDFLNEKEVRCEMEGYVKGLRDAGLITDYEMRVLSIYMKLKPMEYYE